MSILTKTMSFDGYMKTSNHTVVSGAGYVSALTVTGDGTNLATIHLYNATSGTATEAQVYTLVAKESNSITFNPPIRLDTGVRVVGSGTNWSFAIAYKAE